MDLLKQVFFSLFTSFNGFLLICVLFIPLERLFHLRSQKVLRSSWGIDVGYYFIGALVRDFVLAVPFSLVVMACAWIPGVHTLRGHVGEWPVVLHILTGLVIGEIGSYWGHRFLHTVPFLWRFHAIHHSAEQMDWLVNIRIHPLETVFLRTFQFAPLYALGFISPAGGERTTILLLLIPLLNALWGYFIHANVKFRFGPLEWLITTPAFHHWHHTNDSKEELNKNYSFVLPVMDVIFGSFYLPKNRVSQTFGIDEKIPENLAAQLIHPFVPSSSQKRVVTTTVQPPAKSPESGSD